MGRDVTMDMSRVLSHMCMSLDGFVAQPDDNPAELFDWYGPGTSPFNDEGRRHGFPGQRPCLAGWS
jgi:hypothetical protein